MIEVGTSKNTMMTTKENGDVVRSLMNSHEHDATNRETN